MSSRPITQEQFDQLLERVNNQAAEIASLRERLAALEGSSGFEVVSTVQAPSVAAGVSSTPTPLVLSSSGISEERRTIARGIGAWLRRCLNSEVRGPSGRDQINLASKIYLVARDTNSVDYNPPLVFTTWSEAKPLCILRGQPSDSIFIGLPSKEEARVAISAAGLEFPAALQR